MVTFSFKKRKTPYTMDSSGSSGRNTRSRRGSFGVMRRYATPFRRMIMYRSLGARVHTFKRVADPIILSSNAGLLSTTGPQYPLVYGGSGFITMGNIAVDQANLNQCVQFGAALKFSLAQVANSAEITQLFENYRIKKVVLAMSLSVSGGSMGDNAVLTQTLAPSGAGATTTACPLLHMAPDYDDNQAPNLTAVLQNSYCQSKRLDHNIIYKTVVPRAQTVVATQQNPNGTPVSGTVAGGLLPRQTWLDSNSPDVAHYGLKMFFQNWFQHPITGFQYALTITPTYYIEAKNVI